MKSKYKIYIVIITSIFAIPACKKLVEVDPPLTRPVSTNVYKSNGDAAAVLTSIYGNLVSKVDGPHGMSISLGLCADELTNFNTGDPSLSQLYTNELVSTNVPFWSALYNCIYTSNAALEGLAASNGVTNAVKTQLIGEAKFMRAFCYFYLVNLWGDVPLIVSTDYSKNSVALRNPQANIYQQIIKDLKDAQSLLNTNYVAADGVSSTSDRVRPTKWAATALLARVYLYTKDWLNAEAQSDSVIRNTTLFSLESDLNAVFLKTSKEAIWQLQEIISGYNTLDGYTYILTMTPNSNNPVALSPFILDAFENGDNRKVNWIGVYTDTIANQTYYYPYKYKVQGGPVSTPVTEYLMVFRITELYLIRAEAEAYGIGGGLSSAVIDLNTIRHRAGLGEYNGPVDQSSIVSAILHERQVELFTEWGHRWLDLKRTNSADAFMSIVTPQKGGTWNTNWQFYPIPLSDLQLDPNLKQNPDY